MLRRSGQARGRRRGLELVFLANAFPLLSSAPLPNDAGFQVRAFQHIKGTAKPMILDGKVTVVLRCPSRPGLAPPSLRAVILRQPPAQPPYIFPSPATFAFLSLSLFLPTPLIFSQHLQLCQPRAYAQRVPPIASSTPSTLTHPQHDWT